MPGASKTPQSVIDLVLWIRSPIRILSCFVAKGQKMWPAWALKVNPSESFAKKKGSVSCCGHAVVVNVARFLCLFYYLMIEWTSTSIDWPFHVFDSLTFADHYTIWQTSYCPLELSHRELRVPFGVPWASMVKTDKSGLEVVSE